MSRIANEIRSEISSLTILLTGSNFLIDSRLAVLKSRGGLTEVGWSKDGVNISPILRDIPYRDCYRHLYDNQQYNFVLSDGALIQLLYRFNAEVLVEQRVCFFPAPRDVDEQSEDRANEEIPVIRIDYSPEQAETMTHSSSHMHLGHARDCRIPTSAPIAPSTFVLFILRSFYLEKLTEDLARILLTTRTFPESILTAEKEAVHFAVPFST